MWLPGNNVFTRHPKVSGVHLNFPPALTENLNEHPIEVFMIKLVTMTSNQFLYMRELLDLDAKKLLISLSLVRDWLEDFK
jgi:hypothetical protein